MPKGIKGFQKGSSVWKGRKHSEETRLKMSESAKAAGTGNWNKTRTIPKEQHQKMLENSSRFKNKRHSLESRKKASESLKGDRNHQWRGGRVKEGIKIRNSLEYRIWREAVFERDDYTCQFCKVRGGDIQADHIKPFAYFPELRLELENGRTLCLPCHRSTFSYLRNFKVKQK